LELEGLSLAIKEAGGAEAFFIVDFNKDNIDNTQVGLLHSRLN
jgi:predicted Fe-Mo cluster-binding NifX family protein